MPSSWEQSRIEIGMSTKRPMELAIVNRAAAVDVERFKESVAPDEGGTQCSSELIRAHQGHSACLEECVAHVRRHMVPEGNQSSFALIRAHQRRTCTAARGTRERPGPSVALAFGCARLHLSPIA